MSTPLPPDLAALERALEATRAPLPDRLRRRILAARPNDRLSNAWFAAAVAAAAAVLMNLSASASLADRTAPPFDPCAMSRTHPACLALPEKP